MSEVDWPRSKESPMDRTLNGTCVPATQNRSVPSHPGFSGTESKQRCQCFPAMGGSKIRLVQTNKYKYKYTISKIYRNKVSNLRTSSGCDLYLFLLPVLETKCGQLNCLKVCNRRSKLKVISTPGHWRASCSLIVKAATITTPITTITILIIKAMIEI